MRASRKERDQASKQSNDESNNSETVESDTTYTPLLDPNKKLEPELPPLQQIQYRSYKQPIVLYHYSTRLLPLRALCNALTVARHGYVHSIIGSDALEDIDIGTGDETPSGCIEAVYLGNVLKHQGSAIGFRHRALIDGDVLLRVEWLCFRGPAQGLLEGARSQQGEEVVDKVGFVEKMGAVGKGKKMNQGMKGSPEHRSWYESLAKGQLKDAKLRITWKDKDKDRNRKEFLTALWSSIRALRPPRLLDGQINLLFFYDFLNAPLLGALFGAIIGLTPVLDRAFLSGTYEGGVFTAWLTESWKNVGGLFVPLPLIVAGISLYTSYQDSRHASSSTSEAILPILTTLFVLLIRFVVWPLVSIGTIYFFATRTSLLGNDPMLWFAMILMPIGPPAMNLITMVQVSDAGPKDERKIAKILTVNYIISPILAFTVVGVMRASVAAM